MTSWRGKSQHILRVLFLLSLIVLTACTKTTGNSIIGAATRITSEIDAALVNAPQLALAGKVTSPDGNRWLNDYVAIVYKDGVEVGRDVSKLGEFPESGAGKHDGLFFIQFQNAYDLTAVDLLPPSPDITFQDAPGVVGIKYIYSWLGDVQPGHRVSVSVPSKRIIYSLVVLPIPLAELPAEFQDGKTELTADNKIIAHAADGAPLELDLGTAVPPTFPTAIPQPAGPGGFSWTRTISGFYGNRWQAWQQYVDGQVVGITWEEFKDESLRYNSDLIADGYVFQPGKEYLFPEN